MFQRTAIFLASLSGVASFADQYMSLTCDGGLHMLPSHPMGSSIDLSGSFDSVVKSFQADLKVMMDKYCPGLTAFELSHYANFLNVEPFLQQLTADGQAEFTTGLEAAKAKCTKDFNFGWFAPAIDFEFMDMPSSCTYADYKAGKACIVAMPVENLSIDIFLQIQKCPTSFIPSMLLGCEGAGCNGIMKPCVSDSDCSTPSTCVKPPLPDDIWDTLNGMLESIALYNSTTDSACNAGTPFSEKFVTKMMNEMMPLLGYGSTPITMGAGSLPGVCGLPLAIEIAVENVTTAVYNEGMNAVNIPVVSNEGMNAVNIPVISTTSRLQKALQSALPTLKDAPCVQTTNDPPVVSCKGLKSTTPQTSKATPFKEYTTIPGSVVIFDFDCEGNVQFGDTSTIAQGRAKYSLNKFLGAATKTMMDTMGCRAGIGNDLSDTVAKFFAPWGMQFWAQGLLNYPNVASFMGGNTMLNKLVSTINFNKFLVVNGMPATCDTTTLLAGKCDMQVDLTGLIKDFGAPWAGPTSVYMKMKTCPAAAGFAMAGQLSCKGSSCQIMKDFIAAPTCSSDYDCGNIGYACKDLAINPFLPVTSSPAEQLFNNNSSPAAEKPRSPFLANMLRRLAGKETSDTSTSLCLPKIKLTPEQSKEARDWYAEAIAYDAATSTVTFGSMFRSSTGSAAGDTGTADEGLSSGVTASVSLLVAGLGAAFAGIMA